LFGKHIDKFAADKTKGVRTMPVIIGQKAARYTTISFWILQYALVGWLVISGQLSIALLIVLLAIPKLMKAVKIFSKPRPEKEPEDLAPDVWPLYLSAHAFAYNKRFGGLFLLGIIMDLILYKAHILPLF
jgi:1,4-dihydroxy-2-naphthoate octaprenyltransferase